MSFEINNIEQYTIHGAADDQTKPPMYSRYRCSECTISTRYWGEKFNLLTVLLDWCHLSFHAYIGASHFPRRRNGPKCRKREESRGYRRRNNSRSWLYNCNRALFHIPSILFIQGSQTIRYLWHIPPHRSLFPYFQY